MDKPGPDQSAAGASAAESAGSRPAFMSGSNGQNASLPSNVKMIWVKNEKGGIRPARITTGIDNGTNVEIVSGLNEGEEVVISMSGGKAAASATSNSSRPRGPFPF